MEAEVRGADTDGQYIDSDLLIYAWKQRSLGNQKVVVPLRQLGNRPVVITGGSN